MNTISHPHVLMISEITADGKLTLGRGISSKILMRHMSHEAELLLHKTRAEYDAIMVGSSTIRIDNSFLTVRMVEGKNPVRTGRKKSKNRAPSRRKVPVVIPFFSVQQQVLLLQPQLLFP